jgi:hypothetical protein
LRAVVVDAVIKPSHTLIGLFRCARRQRHVAQFPGHSLSVIDVAVEPGYQLNPSGPQIAVSLIGLEGGGNIRAVGSYLMGETDRVLD